MNKAEWTNDFSFLYFDYKKKSYEIEEVLHISLNSNKENKEDTYKKSKGNNYYGKKRRNYIDYC